MRKVLSALFVLGICLFAQDLFAQGGPPGNLTGAPIDGATGALLLAVAGYGYARLKKKEVSENQDQETTTEQQPNV